MQPLELVIKKGIDGAASATPTSNQTQPQEQSTEVDVTKKAVMGKLINTGKQILSNGIRHYTTMSGNSKLQESIDTSLDLIAIGATFAATGPIVGTIIVGLQTGVNAFSSYAENERKTREIEFNNQRLGKVLGR